VALNAAPKPKTPHFLQSAPVSDSSHGFEDLDRCRDTTFGALASRYVEEFAKRKNKSWRQADTLIRRYVLPVWGELDASTITRTDVRAVLGKINGSILSNLASAAFPSHF
jgi:hypothetical protein